MIERVLKFSLDNRWLVVLLAILAAGLGAYSLLRLPIDAVPDITNNQVQINTENTALSVAEMEKQVTYPIETALAGIPGLEYTRSLSRNGFSQVTAVFEEGVDIYFARQQVNERLQEARPHLPPGSEPVMGPISTGLGEVCMWTIAYTHPAGKGIEASDGKPGWQSDGTYFTPEGEYLRNELELAAYLRTVQDWIIRPRLKEVKGVAGVDAIGGFVKQYHVQPDPMKLVSYGLTFHDVIEALEHNNVSAGAGYIEHKGESYLVRANGRIENEEQIEGIVIGTRNGTPIHLNDIATVRIGRELRTGSASKSGEEVVVGTALMLIGANSRTVARDVNAELNEINKTLPSDIQATVVLNRTTLVDATIRTVTHNLFEGAILVVAILLLLLGNLRAAFITALAIPLSMLLTAIGMVETRISGNLMSLGAIDFGLIVDGSVIIVENCLRRLGEKQHALGRKLSLAERLEEVRLAAREVIGPSAFGQAIIITVYVPILTLTDVEGKMFKPMAWTVIFALMSAFVLSMTLVPALVGLAMGGRLREKENFLIRWAKAVYAPLLKGALRWRLIVVSAAIAAFAGSVCVYILLLGQEFVPALDEGDIALHAMRIPSTALTQSTQMQLKVERAIGEFPQVALVFSKTGTAEIASDPMPPNVSDTFVILWPRERWPDPKLRKDALIEQIEHRVKELSGHQYEFTQPIAMRFNELIAGVRSDIAVKVYGDSFPEMERAGEQIARVLRRIPGAQDVKVEQTAGLPVMSIDVDRVALGRHGLDVADVQEVVAIAIGGRVAGEVFQGDRRFDLVVRLPENVRADLSALESLPIPLPHDEAPRVPEPLLAIKQPLKSGSFPFVPLGAVASITVEEGPNQVSRDNGKRRVVVQANVRGRDIGSFVEEAQRAIAREVKIPPGHRVEWGGSFENLTKARARLKIVVPICFFLIFLLLFSSFRSVRDALIVFSCVPLAVSGGILALWYRGMPFSISAGVGFIALSGVAVLNGLVMVSFIRQLRGDGKRLSDAITQGAMTRLRPVLMTALVAILGFVPMALATGRGAEVQQPLATVVIGGLISATALTLLVLPALYSLCHRDPTPARG